MAAALVAVRHSRKKSAHLGDPEVKLCEKVPTVDQCIKVGNVERLTHSIIGGHWNTRCMSLTEEDLYFSKPDDDQILDFIPLIEVTKFELVANDGQEDKKPAFAKSFRGSISMKRFDSATGSEADDVIRDLEPEERELVVRVCVVAEGHNSGKSSVFRFQDIGSRDEWLKELESARKEAIAFKERLEDPGFIKKFQRSTAALYETDIVQYTVGLVIFSSYISSIVGSELLPEDGTKGAHFFKVLEYVYTGIFAAELMVNMFGSWFWPFFASGWNIFDFLVVITSLIALVFPGMPAVNVLRLIRVFKMVRLFRKLTALRVLINALSSSVVPVLYSFVILILISSIYSVLATDLFRPQGEYKSETSFMFSTFSSSLFTLFQVASGDSWASVVTRGLMSSEDVEGHGVSPATVAIFFSSYVLIVGVVLMNIVVAVLLDEFISTVAREKAEAKSMEQAEIEAQKSSHTDGPLDPMIRGLLDFVESGDLSARIHKIFQRMDLDENGGISLQELNAGLKKLFHNSKDSCQLTPEDFEQITSFGDLTDEHDELDLRSFETMIMTQLRQFVNKKICAAIARTEDDVTAEQLFGVKMIIMNLQMLQSRFDHAFPESDWNKKKISLKQTMLRWVERGSAKAFNAWRCITFHPEQLEEHFEAYQDRYVQKNGLVRESGSYASLRRLSSGSVHSRSSPNLFHQASWTGSGRRRSNPQAEFISLQSQNTTPPPAKSPELQSDEPTLGPDAVPAISSVAIEAIDFSVSSEKIMKDLAHKAASLDSMMQKMCELHQDMKKDILSLSLRGDDLITSQTRRLNVAQPQHSVSQASVGVAAEVVWVHTNSHSDNIGDGYGHNGTNGVNPYLPLDAGE